MQTLVIGIGNEYRSDDGAGLVAARRVREKAPKQITVLEAGGEGATLMEAWKEAKSVILIDAACSGTEPGTIHRIEAHRQPLPTTFFHRSSHAFSVAEAVELARALGELPSRLVVYGIEGKTFVAGAELSPEVDRATWKVVDSVLQDVAPE